MISFPLSARRPSAYSVLVTSSFRIRNGRANSSVYRTYGTMLRMSTYTSSQQSSSSPAPILSVRLEGPYSITQ
ncbi:hypothetical protein CJF31_00009136 [Rutstroemia sp. NJR-2017a BVV2]|nr:hypothetical protein CJF31_00009136 [Rutstroemia sp. NJR-2017a BVV2]